MFKTLCNRHPVYAIYLCVILMLLTVAFVLKPSLAKMEDLINEQLKVCRNCGNYEVKDAVGCEECGGTDFALNWCDGCESVFEDDREHTFCPICGKKQ